jgi:hypothetical protein
MLEKEVEKYLCKQVKEIGGLCEKFTSPANRSVPDRLVTLPHGLMMLVECKSPTGAVSKAQQHDHATRFKLGVQVNVLSSKDEVDKFIFDCKEFIGHES